MDKKKLITTLVMIESDMEQDTIEAEGKPFTGQVVAEELGKIRATIAGLAKIVRMSLEET